MPASFRLNVTDRELENTLSVTIRNMEHFPIHLSPLSPDDNHGNLFIRVCAASFYLCKIKEMVVSIENDLCFEHHDFSGNIRFFVPWGLLPDVIKVEGGFQTTRKAIHIPTRGGTVKPHNPISHDFIEGYLTFSTFRNRNKG